MVFSPETNDFSLKIAQILLGISVVYLVTLVFEIPTDGFFFLLFISILVYGVLYYCVKIKNKKHTQEERQKEGIIKHATKREITKEIQKMRHSWLLVDMNSWQLIRTAGVLGILGAIFSAISKASPWNENTIGWVEVIIMVLSGIIIFCVANKKYVEKTRGMEDCRNTIADIYGTKGENDPSDESKKK